MTDNLCFIGKIGPFGELAIDYDRRRVTVAALLLALIRERNQLFFPLTAMAAPDILKPQKVARANSAPNFSGQRGRQNAFERLVGLSLEGLMKRFAQIGGSGASCRFLADYITGLVERVGAETVDSLAVGGNHG